MAKSARSLEGRLSALDALKEADEDPTPALKKALGTKTALVIERAARIVQELESRDLADDVAEAFERRIDLDRQADPGCRALTALVETLLHFEYIAPSLYEKGIRKVQKEPVWGGTEDSAAPVRVASALALVRTRAPRVMDLLVPLLRDPEWPARAGAARAMGDVPATQAVALLRYKALEGDASAEVLGECFRSLLHCEPEVSVEFVAKFLDDTDEAKVITAALALGESRDVAALTPLSRAAERVLGEDLKRALYLAIASLRRNEAFECLLSVVEKESEKSASLALEALRIQRHDPTWVERIESALEDRGDRALWAEWRNLD